MTTTASAIKDDANSSGRALDDGHVFWALRLKGGDVASAIFGHFIIGIAVAAIVGIILWFFVLPFHEALIGSATIAIVGVFFTVLHGLIVYRPISIPSTYFANAPAFEEGGKLLTTINQLVRSANIRSAPSLPFGGEMRIRIYYTTKFKGLNATCPFVLFDGDDGVVLIITPQRFWYDTENDTRVSSWILAQLKRINESSPTSTATVDFGGNDDDDDTRWNSLRPTADDTSKLEVTAMHSINFVSGVHKNHEVIDSQWEHVTKSGEPDYRYKNNKTIYTVKEHNVSLSGPNDFNLTFGPFNTADQAAFANALSLIVGKSYVSVDEDFLTGSEQVGEDSDEWVEDEHDFAEFADEDCYTILGVDPNASEEEINLAARERLKEYHPDTVQSRGPKIRQLANEETKKIIAARDEALRRL